MAAACDDAEEGGAIVREAIDAMASIERVSGEISTITGLIDGIAFQTNLLALNAGVEAARAGDAGMGFAVIASEVRALARRSTGAAREISRLISRSVGEVEQGVRLVASTGQALDRIVAQVNTAQAKVGDIAVASEGQATAVIQVDIAITSMDGTTQQNAAMVEESTAAARSLLMGAGGLTELVGRFAFGTDAGRVRAPSPW